MEIPWYLKPDWLLHADMMDEHYYSRVRDENQDKEIDQLRNRVSELEAQLLALERYLSEKGILPPIPEDPGTPEPTAAGSKSAGEPATFPTRTEEKIVCPHCGRRQKGNRNACYSCGTPFLYKDE